MGRFFGHRILAVFLFFLIFVSFFEKTIDLLCRMASQGVGGNFHGFFFEREK